MKTFLYQNQTTKIIINEEEINDINTYLPQDSIIITDTNIVSYYANLLENNTVIVVPSGEECKSLTTYQMVCERLLTLKCTKETTLVSFGGGTVGDLTGFVASTFKRGLKLIQIPTTLIAQVDASIGGKNALNLNQIKNQIGTIYQPQKVIINPSFLKTLPQMEFNNGMAEVIKYALLFDPSMFKAIETESYRLRDIIERAVTLKGEITQKDEFDRYERASLNFGHTLGHAIESKFSLKHGESIAWGMVLETKNTKLRERITSLLSKFNLLKPISINKEDIFSAILQDKKRKNDQLLMVDLQDIGQFQLKYKTLSQLKEEISI